MKTFLFIILLFSNLISNCQINVGPNLWNVPQSVLGFRKTDFIPSDIEALKNSTTYFIYREDDENNLPEIKKQLASAWKLNELKFISFDEYLKNPSKENASYFKISSYHHYVNSTDLVKSANSLYTYLTLNMKINGVDKIFARIDLHPDFQSMNKGMLNKTDQEKIDYLTYIYSSQSQIYNWNLLFLKNSFLFISDKLEKSELFWMFEENVHKNMSKLKTKTLYIPDYEMIRFNPFSGNESTTHNVKKLLKKYPYTYQVVSIKELESIVQQSEEPIYYLSYVRCNIDKYFTVFEAKSGDMLYYNYTKISYNLKNDDFKKLKKVVKRSK